MTLSRLLPLLRSALGAVFLLLATQAQAVCTVSAPGLSFGNYDPFSALSLDGAGNIAVDCNVPYSLSLSSGAGSYAGRVMASGGNSLGYNLYLDAARTIIWGDGSSGSSTTSGSGGTGVVNHPVYGRIPARQNVPAGSYTDSIIVTLSF